MRVELEEHVPPEPSWLHLGELRLRVPDEKNRSPAEWWVIEALTGVPADRVVEANAELFARPDYAGPSEPMRHVISVLESELEEAGDAADLDSLRRWGVRRRFIRGLLPILFVGRLDLGLVRARLLLEDTLGDQLFAVPGPRHMLPAIIRGDRGRAEVKVLATEPEARGVLARAVRFARSGHPPKPCAQPPAAIVQDLIAYVPEWPVLDGIARVPGVREDGSIITTAGYDTSTKLWYDPEPAFRGLTVPDNPTEAELVAARDALLYPISQFPFVDGPAPALAPVFERIAFPLLHGPRPLFVFDAPPSGQGTGKSLLADIASTIVSGASSHRKFGTSEAEIEKRITSLLRGRASIHTFDNIRGVLASESLEMLATSTVWTGRTLGVSESPPLPNNATWLFTLNGAKFNRDIARRAVLVRLDAKLRDGKEFEIRYPVPWTQQHRATLVQAALVLVRGWVRAGCPVDQSLRNVRGGFERWLDVVGSILTWIGIPGLAAALAAAELRDVNAEEDREFVAVWHATYGYNFVQASELAALAESRGLYGALLSKYQGTWRARKLADEVLARLHAAGVTVLRTLDGFTLHALSAQSGHQVGIEVGKI